MKLYLKLVFAITVVLYMTVAFVTWKLNPAEWSSDARMMTSMFWGFGILLITMTVFTPEDFRTKKQ